MAHSSSNDLLEEEAHIVAMKRKFEIQQVPTNINKLVLPLTKKTAENFFPYGLKVPLGLNGMKN